MCDAWMQRQGVRTMLCRENSLKRHGRGNILAILRLALIPTTAGLGLAQDDRLKDLSLPTESL